MPEPRRVKVTGSLFEHVVPEGALYVGRGCPGLPGSAFANPFALKKKFRRGDRLRRIVDEAVYEVTSLVSSDLDETHYDVISPGTPAVAVAAYRLYLAGKPALIVCAHRDLRGRDLACWCDLPADGQPDLCHAAYLIELVNPGLVPREQATRTER